MSKLMDQLSSKSKKDKKDIPGEQLTKKVKVADPKIGSYEEMMLNHAPNVVVGISFVDHGYQADVWHRKTNGSKANTYHCSTECRDFGGSYKVTELTEEFMQRFWDLIEEFRKDK